MANGKAGDDPIHDLLHGGLHPYPAEVESLIRDLVALNPHVFSSELRMLSWAWTSGRHLPEARTLLEGMIANPGDQAVRFRLIAAYRAAIAERGEERQEPPVDGA